MKTTMTRSNPGRIGVALLLSVLIANAITPAARAGSLWESLTQSPAQERNQHAPTAVAAVRG